MDPHENGEPRLPVLRQPLVLVSDTAADLRRALPLFVGEARADLKFVSVVISHVESSEHERAAACALNVLEDGGLRIIKLLDLQQLVRALPLVLTVRLLEHEAFTAFVENFFQLGVQVLLILADHLLVENYVPVGAAAEHLLNGLEPVGELASEARSVVNHILYLLPPVAAVHLAHDAHGVLEIIPLGPQLAVQRQVGGEQVLEPLGRHKAVSISRIHRRSVPEAADSVEFLGHHHAGGVLGLHVFGEHHSDGARASGSFHCREGFGSRQVFFILALGLVLLLRFGSRSISLLLLGRGLGSSITRRGSPLLADKLESSLGLLQVLVIILVRLEILHVLAQIFESLRQVLALEHSPSLGDVVLQPQMDNRRVLGGFRVGSLACREVRHDAEGLPLVTAVDVEGTAQNFDFLAHFYVFLYSEKYFWFK